MKNTGIALCILWMGCLNVAYGQTLKRLEHDDVKRWKKIGAPLVSADGEWVAYILSPSGEGDAQLNLWRQKDGSTSVYPRAKSPAFSGDSRFLAFLVSPPLDTLKALRRKKVKDPDLPKDTLYLLDLQRKSILRLPNVRHFELPERWNNTLIYQPEAFRPDTAQQTDSLGVPKPKPKFKKENKENGYRLILRLLDIGKEDTIPYVTQYALARDDEALLAVCSGYRDSLLFPALTGFDKKGYITSTCGAISARRFTRAKRPSSSWRCPTAELRRLSCSIPTPPKCSRGRGRCASGISKRCLTTPSRH